MPKTVIPELQTEVPKPHPVLGCLLGAYDYNRVDTIHYPDHNLITHKDGAARRYSQSDGSPYPERTSK